ncbi:MAG: DUF4091 domain-containing protein [Armatimonadota bacterium]
MATQYHYWLSTSLKRWYPRSEPATLKTLKLQALWGEQVSFQVCTKMTQTDCVTPVSVEIAGAEGLSVRLRRVGCVPVPHFNTVTPEDELDGVGHLPGYVPDILFDETCAQVAPNEVQSFWVTVKIPTSAGADAPFELEIMLKLGDVTRKLSVKLQVLPHALQPRQNFPVTQWFYADSLCDWYKVDPWTKPLWSLLKNYFDCYTGHGFDTLLTPLFTPPLDGVKRPTQLLRVSKEGRGRYSFDWSDVEKWVKLAKASGVENFEWCHFFAQWGVKHALRIYEGQGLEEKLLWAPETGATSETYRGFLSQLLPELHNFLKAKRLLDKSFFHVSDEPHGEEHKANYIAARGLLQELAPWIKTMDALSEIDYGREGLTDMPVPSIRVTKQYWEEGIPSWTYFCCGPRGRFLNRLHDTPLPKLRMAGWLFHRFQRLGFLHWGFNYWYKSQTRQMIDPFVVTDGLLWPGWAYGDTTLVYPGECGPIESIRGQVFAESLQDFALLQMAGVDPDGKLLAPLNDFDDYPKDEAWQSSARAKVLKSLR